MAKGSGSKTDQKLISSFFGGGKKGASRRAAVSSEADASSDVELVDATNGNEDETPDVSSDAPAVTARSSKSRKKSVEPMLEPGPESSPAASDAEMGSEDEEPAPKAKAKAKPPVKAKAKAKAKPAAKGKTKVKDDGDEEGSDPEQAEHTKSGALSSWQADLPPIHEIPSMFADIVSRVDDLADVARFVQGRKLRVATMCSGTESPLLALEQISRALQGQHGVKLDIEHVFSCEIEPFKQAYIERNFKPPLLFRDVTELGQSHAMTAYGSLAPVPGNVDILIAGTSCVDYSGLNNQKQEIESDGESGRTFRGMMNWVQNHRPALVILENVKSAPWPKVVSYFEEVGYSSESVFLDTKKYYIPHTRQRGYLVAVNKKDCDIAEEWKDLVLKLARPASSTLDEFLLPSDDPRIHEANEKLAVSAASNSARTGRTEWIKCEQRHQRARLEGELGDKRPLTQWESGGYPNCMEFINHNWARGQVERVWDLMDITFLKNAQDGVDSTFKTQIWNLSQNVDRNIATKYGLSPCLTPSMIAFITNRGGPMIGLEALGLQGLPTDELLLTRESEDQLADLAGNAMSTTVVGTCLIAALITGKSLLRSGDDEETYEEKDATRTQIVEVDVDGMDIDMSGPASDDVEGHISGEADLITKPLENAGVSTTALSDILAAAHRSVRLCVCEGRSDMTDRPINRCTGCGASSCIKCGGRPEHEHMERVDVISNPRLSPADFAKQLMPCLPKLLTFSGITEEYLDALLKESGASVPDKRWAKWRKATLRATEHELAFRELKRRDVWTAVYESSTARAELSLHPQQPEWIVFAKVDPSETAHAEIRPWLAKPIARLACKDQLLRGQWRIALPSVVSGKLKIEGEGELVPAWGQRLGLRGEQFKEQTVHSALNITLKDSDQSPFERDIEGKYVLLDNCGTANSALHKRVAKDGEDQLPPIFLFLDPTRIGAPALDSFVLSISCRRYEYEETRPVIARLDSSWRQSGASDVATVPFEVPSHWVDAAQLALKPFEIEEAKYSTPSDSLSVDVSLEACRSATAVLSLSVPLPEDMQVDWPQDGWVEVDKIHELAVFKKTAFLFESVPSIGDMFSTWQSVQTRDQDLHQCPSCAPTPPTIQFAEGKNSKMTAVEDPVQAGEYERRLKGRPPVFVTQYQLNEHGVLLLRIGINIASLLHRAFSRLPFREDASAPTLSWRMEPNFVPHANTAMAKFRLSSNRHDPSAGQPPNFKSFKLRPEQLRSLHWELERERNPGFFIEEEISEAMLLPLGWRMEGRAQREVAVRGGVLADQVGYGKTAITLGLIDCTMKEIQEEFAKRKTMPGKIPTKATLIVVPPHLTKQWPSEIKKFLGSKYKVVTLTTASSLNSATISEIMEAHMVVVASNLFHSNVYLENLVALSAGGELPNQEGRYFDARLTTVLESLGKQVDRLRDEGSMAVFREIGAGRKRWNDEKNAQHVNTKRLKGRQYRDAQAVKKVEPAAAAKKTPKPKVEAEASTTAELPKRKMEVVIQPFFSRTSSKANASSSGDEAPSPKATRPQRRRTASSRSKVTVLSDEEEDKDSGSDFKASPPASDVEESAEDASESSAAESDDDDDDEPVSRKGKGKAKAAPKRRAPAKKRSKSSASNLDETMDETDDVSAKSDSSMPKKRKAAEDGKQPKKKARTTKDAAPKKLRETSDPWKLKSSAVQRDWDDMQCPPLEMFHFARVVIDEYTYLAGKTLSMVSRISSDRHWVLSGTPPTHNFAALKTIAQFLGLHLGVDDDGEGGDKSVEIKKRRAEQTAVEKFHSFREVHSHEWHAHRHEVGQGFLDMFVRQNIAEIDEIPSSEKLKPITLPAAELAIYLELLHHLRALDMTIKRSKKTDGDREKRLQQSLGDSATAEEALLKRCSHFDLHIKDKDNAMKACEVIVQERTEQLKNCTAELEKLVVSALKLEKSLGKLHEETAFREWIRVSRTEGCGDSEATDIVRGMLEDAAVGGALKNVTNQPGPKAKGKGKPSDEYSTKVKDGIWELRELTHKLRGLTKELVGRCWSLRFFTWVRDCQKQKDAPLVVACVGCGRDAVPLEEIAVLSSCGHVGCRTCVVAAAEREECLQVAAGGECKAAARVPNIVMASTLGIDDEKRDGQGKHYGKKLEDLVDLIKNKIPKDERVLVFVQFGDLMKKVAQALSAHKIQFLEIQGTAHTKSSNLQRFQDGGPERVLLLNVMDESASGANLTGANHAVFLSPLLAPSQEIYDACETQAIGRLRRFGQRKHVYVYRFLTENTIDVEIFEERTGRKDVLKEVEMEVEEVE